MFKGNRGNWLQTRPLKILSGWMIIVQVWPPVKLIITHVRRRRLHWYWYYASVFAVFFKGMLRVLEDDQLFQVSRCHRLVCSHCLDAVDHQKGPSIDFLTLEVVLSTIYWMGFSLNNCIGFVRIYFFINNSRKLFGHAMVDSDLLGGFFIPKIWKKLTSTQWGPTYGWKKWLTTWTFTK